MPPKISVDATYLQATAKLVHEIKKRSYSLMQFQAGDKVLDVGCGPGSDTLSLASLVGTSGHVVGVDSDSAMIDEANKRSRTAGIKVPITHQCADAAALPFEMEEFNSCRSERLFQHLPHPEQALSEMIRVTRSGGRVVVVDTDWGSLSVDTPEVATERRLTRFHAECLVQNGFSGRQLPRLLLDQNLADVTVELFPIFVRSYIQTQQLVQLERTEKEALAAGFITHDEVDRWRSSLASADANGVFFASCNVVVVSGRKP